MEKVMRVALFVKADGPAYNFHMISRLPLSASLLLAVSVQVLCQLFKAVFYSLR